MESRSRLAYSHGQNSDRFDYPVPNPICKTAISEEVTKLTVTCNYTQYSITKRWILLDFSKYLITFIKLVTTENRNTGFPKFLLT